jgi:hypothetical protein
VRTGALVPRASQKILTLGGNLSYDRFVLTVCERVAKRYSAGVGVDGDMLLHVNDNSCMSASGGRSEMYPSGQPRLARIGGMGSPHYRVKNKLGLAGILPCDATIIDDGLAGSTPARQQNRPAI